MVSRRRHSSTGLSPLHKVKLLVEGSSVDHGQAYRYHPLSPRDYSAGAQMMLLKETTGSFHVLLGTQNSTIFVCSISLSWSG